MAISTYKTFLMGKETTGATWAKIIDIKSYPDLGGTPNQLETTTLSDYMQTFINGIQQSSTKEFDANFDKTEYQDVKTKYCDGNSHEFAVWFGGTESGGVLTPTGSEGKISWTGDMSMFITGGGVDEVVGAKMSISLSTPIVETFS